MLPKTTPTRPAISGVLATPFQPVSQLPKNGNPGDTPFFYTFCILPTPPRSPPRCAIFVTPIFQNWLCFYYPPIYYCRFHFLDTQPPLLYYYTKYTPVVKIKTLKIIT